MKAITALTRGYLTLQGYDTLIQRNQAIYQHINKGLNIPLILFHEGNITPLQQDYIKANSCGQEIAFIDISEVWQGGYEGMCRFQMYDAWEYLKDYDAILRIDEDCIVSKCENNPFELLGDNVFLKSVDWGESHSETNATLPGFIESVTRYEREQFYNNKFPYTNVCLCVPKFWLDLPLLKVIAESPLQKANRWGDLPVFGSLLNIYAQGKVGTLKGLSYYHQSHNTTIECK